MTAIERFKRSRITLGVTPHQGGIVELDSRYEARAWHEVVVIAGGIFWLNFKIPLEMEYFRLLSKGFSCKTNLAIDDNYNAHPPSYHALVPIRASLLDKYLPKLVSGRANWLFC